MFSAADRGDGVGGAGCCGDDPVMVGDRPLVDPVEDVLEVPLAGRRDQDLVDAGAGEVSGEAVGVAPTAGVVNQQGVLDAVDGVVDRGWVARVDGLDDGAVGGDGVAVRVDGDGAVEGAVHGVAAQQAGAFDEVVGDGSDVTVERTVQGDPGAFHRRLAQGWLLDAEAQLVRACRRAARSLPKLRPSTAQVFSRFFRSPVGRAKPDQRHFC
jgi:hypothetical protein